MKRNTQKAIDEGQKLISSNQGFDMRQSELRFIYDNNGDDINKIRSAFLFGVAIGSRINKQSNTRNRNGQI